MIRRILAISRLHLSVCLWRRRPFAVASLVIATARWIARVPLALTCRLALHVPSRISRVARRRNGEDPLHSRVIRGCIPARAFGAVDLRTRRSSSPRRPISRARHSRSRVAGVRLPRRRPSFALIVATTVLLSFRVSRVFISACASGAVGLRVRRSSTRRCPVTRASLVSACCQRAPPVHLTFLRFACRHDGVARDSRLSRFLLGVCLRRRRSLLASLVVTTASQITRASLAPACRRRAPPAPPTLLRFARRHHGAASPHVSRVSISACASRVVGLCIAHRHDSVPNHSRVSRVARRRDGVHIAYHSRSRSSTLLRVARPHDGAACVPRFSHFHLGVCPGRRRSSFASLVITTA